MFTTIFSIAISAAIIVFAACYGISKIASKGVEAIGRQPEAAGKINNSMIVSMSMIEGAAFFGLVICFLLIILCPPGVDAEKESAIQTVNQDK